MLMATCWKCQSIRGFTTLEELYLLKTVYITCAECGAENFIGEEIKQNIRVDWGIKG